MYQHLLPQAFLHFSTTHHSSLHVDGPFELGDPPAEEPDLDDVRDHAELEEGDLPILLLGLELRRDRALAVAGPGPLDALEDPVGPAVEAIGGDEDPADPLVSPLVVVLVDPSADLLLGVEVVAELDPVDQLLLDVLVDGLDLSERLLCQLAWENDWSDGGVKLT